MQARSQKELAEKIREAIAEKEAVETEVSIIRKEKNEFIREQKLVEVKLQQAVGDMGYVISVPNTEIILYEDDGYQLLYCNNSEHPSKISFLMALKQGSRKVTGRTPITSQGYVAIPMPKDQFNLILSSHQRSAKIMRKLEEKIAVLEKEIAPLKYIDHLIKKHKEDTK